MSELTEQDKEVLGKVFSEKLTVVFLKKLKELVMLHREIEAFYEMAEFAWVASRQATEEKCLKEIDLAINDMNWLSKFGIVSKDYKKRCRILLKDLKNRLQASEGK